MTMLVTKSSPPGLSLLILIISTSSMFGLGSVVKKTYTHEPLHYTWEEARQNCKSSNSHLAIVQTEEDKGMINYQEYYAWLYLSKDIDSGTWMWNTDSTLNIYPWAEGEPQPTESCAAIFGSTLQLYGFPCEDYFFFTCEHYTGLLFFDESKTRKEAQEYCQHHFIEIFIWGSGGSSSYDFDFSLWIDTVTGSNRPGSEPNQSDKCSTLRAKAKTVAARNCSERFPSVCMTDNVILIMEKKTWEEAMTHCRKLVLSPEDQSRYELVSVEAGIDDAYLRARASQADTEQVWVGLRFLGGTWFWINGISMRYPDLPQCPLPGKNCGVISKTSAHLEMADCGEKKNFLCYKL